VRNLKNVKTTMLCSRGTSAEPRDHIPNNTDITVTYKGGQGRDRGQVLRDQPVERKSRDRVWEKQFNLNTGSSREHVKIRASVSTDD